MHSPMVMMAFVAFLAAMPQYCTSAQDRALAAGGDTCANVHMVESVNMVEYVSANLPGEASPPADAVAPDVPLPLPEQNGIDQSGRTSLLVGSTLWATTYYGTATGYVIFGDEDGHSRGRVASWLIMGGLGYLIPSLLTQNTTVTEGMATLALGGMFQGAMHGWLLDMAIQGENVDVRTGFALSVLGGISETVAGFLVARNNHIAEGTASVLNVTSFYGMAAGVTSAALIMGETDFRNDVDVRMAGALGLVGAATGILVGDYFSSRQDYSVGDSRIFATVTALAGTLPLVAYASLANSGDDIRILGGTTLLGIAGGLVLGDAMVKGYSFSNGSGTVATLSALAGGLMGGGVAYLLSPDGGDIVRAFPLCIWAGAATGFAIAYLSNTRESADGGSSRGDLRFDINPLGMAFLGTDQPLNVPIPLASLSMRF